MDLISTSYSLLRSTLTDPPKRAGCPGDPRSGIGRFGLIVRVGGRGWEGRCKATWKREFKLPWREAVPPNHHDDKVDSDQ